MSVKSTHGVSAAAKDFWLCAVFKGVRRASLRSAADHDRRLENLFPFALPPVPPAGVSPCL